MNAARGRKGSCIAKCAQDCPRTVLQRTSEEPGWDRTDFLVENAPAELLASCDVLSLLQRRQPDEAERFHPCRATSRMASMWGSGSGLLCWRVYIRCGH